jgi:hypothetical protein
MGTLIQDALAATLSSTQAVTADANGDEGVVDVQWPLEVQIEGVVGTAVAGAGQVYVTIQASNDSTMTNFVNVGSIGPITATSGTASAAFRGCAYIPYRYVRSRIEVEGTVSAGTITVKLRDEHNRRVVKHPLETTVTGATTA